MNRRLLERASHGRWPVLGSTQVRRSLTAAACWWLLVAAAACSRAERSAVAARGAAAASSATAAPTLAARSGKVLFARYCVLCHGAGGAGDGVNAPNLSPPPRNHTDPRRAAQRSDAQLFAAIRDGHGVGAGAGPPGQRGMPPFGRTLRPYQIWDLVAHLRELGRGGGPLNRQARK